LSVRTVQHDHVPVFRVVRVGWRRPLDASFSQTKGDRRWNTPDFPALYCCCSVLVARAVTRDLFRLAGITESDLAESYRPRLIELEWAGRVADVASEAGIESAELPSEYPEGTAKSQTRERAERWFAGGLEGVVCRSASLARLGWARWSGSHPPWGEVAVFVASCGVQPRMTRDWGATGWLGGEPDSA
jgi:RES domain-containing protein